MNSLLYIVQKSLKNYWKAYRNKAIAIVFLIVFFATMIILSSMYKNPSSGLLSKSQFESYVMATLFIFSLFLLPIGVKQGASFFRAPDINFVFTAPITHQRVLIYGFIKQVHTTLVMTFFLYFQIPNLQNLFQLTTNETLLCITWIAIFTFIQSVISMTIYMYTSKNRRLEKNILRGIYFVGGVAVVILLWFYKENQNIHEVISIVFGNKWMEFIPIIGTIKAIICTSINGMGSNTLLHSVLLFVYMAICISILLMSKIDFYEEVLEQTEVKEQKIKLKKNRYSGLNTIRTQKVRKVKGQIKAKGAKAIFERHLLELNKTGYFLMDQMTIGYVVGSVIWVKIVKLQSLWGLLVLAIYLLFIFSFMGRWTREINKPYIYLIPASSFSKIWYATYVNHIKNAVDAVALFVVSSLLIKASVVEIMFCIVTYVLAGALFVYSNMLRRRVFGKVGSETVGILFDMLLLVILLVVGGVVFGIVNLTICKRLVWDTVEIFIFVNIYLTAVISLMILGTKGLFEHIEL